MSKWRSYWIKGDKVYWSEPANIGKTLHVIEVGALKEAEERIAKLVEHLTLALAFCPFRPDGVVPKGLDPTFYHTLDYLEDCEIQNRIDAAHEYIAELSKAQGE